MFSFFSVVVHTFNHSYMIFFPCYCNHLSPIKPIVTLLSLGMDMCLQIHFLFCRGKPCRYFDQGKGECPFNDKCFYRHALPDGTLVERKPQVPRRRVNADGEVEITVFHLWDFLERESYRRTILLQSSEDELYMLMNIFADSDSEETSDQDLSDDDW